MGEHFDVVVVGAGSAGGTVAARLSQDPSRRVLLIEAGPDFPDEEQRPPAFLTGGALYGHRGAGSGAPSPALDWGYASVPLPGGRTVPLPRGRLVGGSSMTNGCVAVRPRPSDLDRWEASGATGWGWDAMLPFIEAAERELAIMTYPQELWMPVQRSFVEACLELGFRWEDDLNAPGAWDGVVGPWPRNRHDEIRQGSLVTTIRASRRRPGFSLLADALVDKVVVDGGRATGVVVVDADGAARTIGGDLVVLCAGAFGSAPILLRSGIGPAGELHPLGIEPLVDLPVGQGLIDHPGYVALVETTRENAFVGWPALAAVGRGDGWWGIPMGFDSRAGVIALGFYLALVECPWGSIRLRSRSPLDAPVIDLAYDRAIGDGLFDGVRRDLDRLLRTETYRALGARETDAGTPFRDQLLRRLGSGHHGAGGCAIGRVVDPDLRVLGLDGLVVADASVFPLHVTNNPNVTVHMVGEVAAARIAGRRAPLPPVGDGEV
jgi:choline dehydrogenase